jgi:hypothetical protein
MVKALSTTLTVVSMKVTGLKTLSKVMVFLLSKMALNMMVHSKKTGWLIELFKLVHQVLHQKRGKHSLIHLKLRLVSQHVRRLSRIHTNAYLTYQIWLNLRQIQVKSRRKSRILCLDTIVNLKVGTLLMLERLRQLKVRSHLVWHSDKYGDSWETAKCQALMLRLLSSTVYITKAKKITSHC